MISILQGRAQLSKKMGYSYRHDAMKIFTHLQDCINFSNKPIRRNITSAMPFSNSNSQIDHRHIFIKSTMKLSPSHNNFGHQFRYIRTDDSIHITDLQTHSGFSKKLNYTEKGMSDEINYLVSEWLRRFDSLDEPDASVISGTLNTLSRLDIFDKLWNRSDQTNFKRLIVRLSEAGNRSLDPKVVTICKFTPWQIANCLNALCKWNVTQNETWKESEIHLFKSFINKLIIQGKWLMDPDNKMSDNFNSKAIANILNALSKWNLEDYPESKEFIVRLMKQGNDRFTSLSVVKTLNAMSKWHVEELRGAKEFIIQLMKQGISMAHKLNSQEVANSLNALSKWNIEELQEAKGFILRLVERGYSTVDQFNCQDIANCLNALCKWNIKELPGSKEFIIRLVKRGSGIAGGFKPQEISNCLNAVSKWDIDQLPGTREFIIQLAKCGHLTAYNFNSQGISNSLNALSKWDVNEFQDVQKFIDQLVKQGCSMISRFSPHGIANSLNALSKWNIEDLEHSQEFIVGLIQRGIFTINGFGSQAISNTLNALTKWNVDKFPKSREFIVHLIERGNSTIEGFEYLAIANTLNALSKWNIDEFKVSKEFINSLIKIGSSKIVEFDSQSVANSLNALSKWNIDELQGSKKFIVQLIEQGIRKADRFNPQEIAGSLNALRKFSIFDFGKWNDVEIKNFKNFVIKIAKKGELMYSEFDSQSVANVFNAFWKLDVFNNEKWSENEQNDLKTLIVCLSSLDEQCANHTLESVSMIYSALLDWNIFLKDEFDSISVKKFERLADNLKNRILTIAELKQLTKPDVDIRFSARIVKDLSELRFKGLIIFDAQVLDALVRCFAWSVENSDASQLMDDWTEKNILSCFQQLARFVSELENKSELEGLFDESLFKVYNHLLKLDVKYADKVLQSINEINELGIITDRRMMAE